MIRPPGGSLAVHLEHWPLIWLWPLSLVLMQLTFARLGAFELTLAVLACHGLQLYLLLVYWVKRPPDLQVVLGGGIILYSLALGIAAQDGLEFAKSLAQLGNLVVTIVICLNVPLADRPAIGRSIVVFCGLAALIGLLIIAQALTFNLQRSLELARPLGELMPLGPGGEVYEPHPRARVWRANGVFSEPSVAAWFMGFATAIALGARRLMPRAATLAATICALAGVATLTLTGLLGMALVVGCYLAFVRDRTGFKLIWGGLASASVAVALYGAWEYGILARFRQLDHPGTSLYFRVTAPLQLVGDSLLRFPWGYPIGQTDFIETRRYYINWDQGSQTNIDNSVLLVVFYFGLLGVALSLGYLATAARYLVLRREAVGLVMVALLIALSTTGAGWAHHFVLMIGYAIIAGRHLLALPPVAARPRSRAAPRLVIRPRSA
jgi:hypothetical protein